MNKLFKKIYTSKVVTNGFWLVVLQSFNTIVPLVTLPYITRVLSINSYGEFSLALNWIGYFQVIVEFGFGLTGARKVARRDSDEELSFIHSNILYSRLLLMLLSFVLLIFISFLFSVPREQFLSMLILFLMVLATVFQQNWLFQGMSDMKPIAIINMVSRIISVILIFSLVNDTKDLYLYCFLYISNFLIASIIGYIIVYKKYNVRLIFVRWNHIITEIKEGWYLFISSAMSKIFSGIGITILGITATKSEVGVYSAINKIPLILTLFFAAVSQAIYPYMCEQFSISKVNGFNMLKKISIPVIILFLIPSTFLIIFNKQLILILFGEQYVAYSMLLVPFVIWVMGGIVNNFLGIQSLVAAGYQKEYSKEFQKSIIFMLVSMLLLGYFYGAFGIAYSSMFSELLLTILLYRKIQKIKKFL
ncbi:oligosaccharide flippase family protein [Vagococcus jeotgali]|uniref:oligosaccharide flippase family protein n=1 Tax=Vagococcus jeotgali TaxID=3109030 RepID=UPI002DD96FDA|nr:oligosaccharide flippase family protein [Vagococcus sp. B2T-5]